MRKLIKQQGLYGNIAKAFQSEPVHVLSGSEQVLDQVMIGWEKLTGVEF